MGGCPNRIGEPPRVSVVRWSARGRAPIPKAIPLLGMEGKDRNATVEPAVHDRSGGDLKGDGPTPGVPAGPRNPPVQKRAEPRTGRRGGHLAPDGSVRCEHTGRMGRPPPVHTDKERGGRGRRPEAFLFSELGPRTASPRDVPPSRYRGSQAHTPYGEYHRPHPRPLSPLGVRNSRGPWVALGEWTRGDPAPNRPDRSEHRRTVRTGPVQNQNSAS